MEAGAKIKAAEVIAFSYRKATWDSLILK